MCACQEKYCYGCGKVRLLIGPLMMCRPCVDDWYRLREREEADVR